MTQLTLMRELLAAFSGNELVFGVVLGNWMLLTGIGAALGRTAPWLKSPIAVPGDSANSDCDIARGRCLFAEDTAERGVYSRGRGGRDGNGGGLFPAYGAIAWLRPGYGGAENP